MKLYWWKYSEQRGNFGDELGPVLCRSLSGRVPVHADLNSSPLVTIGSLLAPHLAKGCQWSEFSGHVWGTGRMYQEPIVDLMRAKVHAVRGYLTLSRIRCDHRDRVVVGDPGLLASRFAKDFQKTHLLGIIPHWSQCDHPAFHSLRGSADVRFISPLEPVQTVIDNTAKCRFVIASSLHGLILADALRIPNLWIQPMPPGKNAKEVGEFKFYDYYSAFELADTVAPIELPQQTQIDDIIPYMMNYSRPGLDLIQRSLLASFPFWP